ncbi:MAG: replicative DNA helicase, partial [Phycisphaera sp.]
MVSVDKLFDRLPPHSLESEMSLLGSMILDPTVIADVLPHVHSDEMFYSAAHAAVFKALIQLYEQHQSGDLVMLVDKLRDAEQLKDIGGEEYLLQLVEAVPSATSAPYYARTVADKHRLRRLIEASGQILYDAYHPSEDAQGVNEVIDKAESKIFAIAEQAQTNEAQELNELLQDEIERLEAIEGKGVSGIPTGFTKLDEMLSGLHKGEMIILAARPSMGKTAMALNLAEQVAFGGAIGGAKTKNEKVPVAFFSLEMSKESITNRLLSAKSGVDSHKMRTGSFTESDFQKLIRAAGDLGEAKIYIDDSPNLSVLALRARARRLVRRSEIKCIIIDYLQLLTSPSAARESRQVEVSEISRGIKALARELDLPVICLAQLNRGTENRSDNRPKLSDLRESGSIEQDADVVMLLHREAYYHIGDEDWEMDNPDKVNLTELIIAKQRNGPTGVVELDWDNRTTRFKNKGDTYDNGGYGGQSYTPMPTPSPLPGQVPSMDTEPKPLTNDIAGGGFSSFGNRAKTGPPADHRDGGGPTEQDDGFDSDE